MTTESALRLCGLVALIAAMAVGFPYRLRAQRRGGSVSRRAEGIPLMIALRLAAAVWAFGFIAWLLDWEIIRAGQVALPLALRWAGAALLMLAVPFYAWVFHHLGLNVTDTVLARQEATLVRTGPYRWVRHPLYAGGAMILTGWALLTANVFVAIAGLVAAALIIRRTAIEERYLVEKFGDAYRDYMASTGAFVPKWRHG